MRLATRSGRGVGRLLADFGHQLPTIPEPPAREREPRLFPQMGRRGERRPLRGWAPASAPASVWRMTADHAPVLWPLVAAPGLPPRGAQMGIDYFSGASMYADPNGWVLDPTIPVSNPNVFMFGKPGQGKSATVKAFCLRMMGFGYRTLIVGDPKDEYEPLCRALGVAPIAIGQGLTARINPLAFGPLGGGWEQLGRDEVQRRSSIVFSRWLTLVRGLVGSQKVGD
ncbi:MAG: ATP-binding protein, partial [Propionicimonas sp.]|nr:ATP-binding protein [Propionicimonas sp.]